MTGVMLGISFETISMKNGFGRLRVSPVIEKCLTNSFIKLCHSYDIYKVAHLIFM